jgi:hypothetical protein
VQLRFGAPVPDSGSLEFLLTEEFIDLCSTVSYTFTPQGTPGASGYDILGLAVIGDYFYTLEVGTASQFVIWRYNLSDGTAAPGNVHGGSEGWYQIGVELGLFVAHMTGGLDGDPNIYLMGRPVVASNKLYQINTDTGVATLLRTDAATVPMVWWQNEGIHISPYDPDYIWAARSATGTVWRVAVDGSFSEVVAVGTTGINGGVARGAPIYIPTEDGPFLAYSAPISSDASVWILDLDSMTRPITIGTGRWWRVDQSPPAAFGQRDLITSHSEAGWGWRFVSATIGGGGPGWEAVIADQGTVMSDEMIYTSVPCLGPLQSMITHQHESDLLYAIEPNGAATSRIGFTWNMHLIEPP